MSRVLLLVTLSFSALAAHATPPKNLQKTRPGSFLKRDTLWEAPPDLRGESERRRDEELSKHFRRMAELDAFAAVAAERRDLALLEEIEDVRRMETARHYRALMRQRVRSQAELVLGARSQPGEKP